MASIGAILEEFATDLSAVLELNLFLMSKRFKKLNYNIVQKAFTVNITFRLTKFGKDNK